MKNAINTQVGMLGDMFLWLVANLKQGVINFIKQELPPNISAGIVCNQIQIRHQNWFDSLVNSACKGTLATTTYIFLVDVVSVATIWAAAQ